MADGTKYCSYCGSTNLIPFYVKYYKCLDCGRIVTSPIVIPDVVAVPEETV